MQFVLCPIHSSLSGMTGWKQEMFLLPIKWEKMLGLICRGVGIKVVLLGCWVMLLIAMLDTSI